MAEVERSDILEAIKQLERKIDDINTALVGSATEDKIGLIERVRLLEAWMNLEKKFAWVIGALIVVDIGSRVFAHFMAAP